MSIDDLYSELSRIKELEIFTQTEKEKLSIEWVNKYAKEKSISFDTALDDLSDYVDSKK